MLNQVKEVFNQFQRDPLDKLRVRLRLKRSEEIRERIFSDPQSITLKFFNEDIWNFASSTKLNGEKINIKKEIFDLESSLEENRRVMWEKALNANELELHGNYIWTSYSSIYHPSLRDDNLKIEYIRQALDILNEPDSGVFPKVKKIMKIPGFGSNSATGLAMICYPSKFAIYNKASQEAVRLLGYSEDSLESFVTSVRDLKSLLNSDNFIELDWFFCLITLGKYKCIPISEAQFIKTEGKRDRQASRISDEDLIQRAKSSPKKPEIRKVSTTRYDRNSYVRETALRRAKGCCQLCDNPATFCDKLGKPFLETHHIKWLSKGGEDSTGNTVALCPNCHRKMHVLDLKEDVQKLKTIAAAMDSTDVR